MMDNDKIKFKATAEDNNNYIRVQIPSKIAEYIKAEPGDTIKFQTEHSEEHGRYASLWNHTKQIEGEEK